MADKATTDINVSTVNQETPGETSDTPSYITSEQFNSAFTARSKSMEKQIAELKDLVSRLSSPKETEEKKPEGIQWKSRVEALEKERDQERQLKVDLEMRTQVKDILTSLNARPSLVKALMAQLIESDKSISLVEGQPAFRNKFGDYVDLETGLKDLAKQPDYQEFFTGKVSIGSGAKTLKNTNSVQDTAKEADNTLYDFFGIDK